MCYNAYAKANTQTIRFGKLNISHEKKAYKIA